MEKFEKLEIIKRISSLRSEGCSYQKIADILQGEGVPTFSRKGIWRRQQIHKILNPPIKKRQNKPAIKLVKVDKKDDPIKKKSALSEKINSLEKDLEKSAKRVELAVSEFNRRTHQLEIERKENERLLKRVDELVKVGKNLDASFEALAVLKSVVTDLKEENVTLKDTIEGLVKLVKKPPVPSVPVSEPVPKFLNVGNGGGASTRWGIQLKKVGQYSYYYANKKIRGKLHSFSVGREFDNVTATVKIKNYMAKKLS